MEGASDSAGVGARAGLRVFVSYRRDDAPDATDRLALSLRSRLGRDQVFLDVDNIDIGSRFAQVVGDWVGRCDVVLAIIGREWLAASDDEGNRRLDDPRDYVRLEIEAGLSREIRVVPVLIHGAELPKAGELPASLAPLLDYNAVELSRRHWDDDVGQLLDALQRIADEGAGVIASGDERGRQAAAGDEPPPYGDDEMQAAAGRSPLASRPRADATRAPQRPAAPGRGDARAAVARVPRITRRRSLLLAGAGLACAIAAAAVVAVLATDGSNSAMVNLTGSWASPQDPLAPWHLRSADNDRILYATWSGGAGHPGLRGRFHGGRELVGKSYVYRGPMRVTEASLDVTGTMSITVVNDGEIDISYQQSNGPAAANVVLDRVRG